MSKSFSDSYKAAGVEPDILYHDVVDAVTGKVLKTRQIKQYEDGHWMMTITNAWKNNSTAVYLPTVYMSEEDAITAADLKSVLQKHIESETAKFVVGNRPLSEFDQFQKELESMGVEEYLNLYTEAYSGYMASVFGE